MNSSARLGRLCGISWLLLALMPAAQAQDVDPADRVARLSYLQGEVLLRPGDAAGNEWTDAGLNRPLTSGDQLWTNNARAPSCKWATPRCSWTRTRSWKFSN